MSKRVDGNQRFKPVDCALKTASQISTAQFDLRPKMLTTDKGKNFYAPLLTIKKAVRQLDRILDCRLGYSRSELPE